MCPDDIWKDRLHNLLASCDWSKTRLNPVPVLVGGERVKLIPHAGEFDFRALLNRSMLYETATFEWIASRSYDTIIEIGANVGIFTVFFAAHYPQAARYSFEPSSLAFERLRENLAANDLTADIRCAAVAESSGVADFFEPAGHLTNGSLLPDFAHIFSDDVKRVQVKTVAAKEVGTLIVGRTLLKIDTEGAEPQILAAMIPLINAKRPDIVVEVLDNTVAAMNRLSEGLAKYEIYRLELEGGHAVARRTSVFEVHEDWRDHALLPISVD